MRAPIRFPPFARARRALALAAALALGLPSGAAAQGDPNYLPEPDQQAWSARLAAGHAELVAARDRAAALETAYSEARHRDYPRGDALAQLLRERDEARAELAEQEAAFPRLLEDARRAGVLPEILRPYHQSTP